MREITEAQLYRDASEVKRYHTKRVLRTQTVGEHTFNMLMLVKQVTEHHRFPASEMLEVYHRVMHHDMPELFTGDVPGPIKRAHPSLGPLMDEIEADLAPLFREDDKSVNPELAQLVKWADRVEGAMWCMDELRLGNQNVRSTIERYLGWLIAARVPDCANELTSELVEQAYEEFHITPATGATLEMKA